MESKFYVVYFVQHVVCSRSIMPATPIDLQAPLSSILIIFISCNFCSLLLFVIPVLLKLYFNFFSSVFLDEFPENYVMYNDEIFRIHDS